MEQLFSDNGHGVLESHDWGALRWVVSGDLDRSATTTVGICRIDPGHSNPLHRHPNCDEVLVVVSGRCEKRIGESVSELGPGDAVRIPRGVEHRASALGDEPLVCVVSYDTPNRQVELL